VAESDRQEFLDNLVVGSYRFGSLLSKFVPGRLTGPVSSAIGLPASLALGEQRRMVDRHLTRVLPRASARERRRLNSAVFDNYTRYYLESFRLPIVTPHEIKRGMTIEGFDEFLLPALAAGRGAIVSLPHLGGWEWAGRWMTDQGFPMTVVVEALQPVELFEWFVDLRKGFGMTVVPLGPDAGPAILKALAANEVVCLLSDRFISGSSTEVDFFGERTLLPAGPATLALRTGAPILPTAVYFTGRGNGHHAVIRPPVSTQRIGRLREDVQRVTQLLANDLEFLIRRAPEQWHLLQPNWPSDPGWSHGSLSSGSTD
jgi:KDO2-lipid IV(A) lauroyltransferase